MRRGRLLVSSTVGLGAFLLFAIEPLAGKAALPWFGGAAPVWTACLAFFQAAVLAGYVYAHLLARRPIVWQVRTHGTLLLASLAWMPILPGPQWAPADPGQPLISILWMLSMTMGLPIVLLSATGPLVQAWRADEGDEPRSLYRLFAWSNVAAVLGLLAYPFAAEPALTLRTQDVAWSVLYGAFTLGSFAIVWQRARRSSAPWSSVVSSSGAAPSSSDFALWFLLAAAPSALLLAVTQFMLRDVAAIPLLWVAPLALYLVSFTLSFGWSRWYYRPLWYAVLLLSVRLMVQPIAQDYVFASFSVVLALYSFGLFVCCAVCHAELAAMRPAPRYLTWFYLVLAGGGAAGGMTIAALAPSVFDTATFDVPLVSAVLLGLVVVAGWRRTSLATRWRRLGAVTCLALLAVTCVYYLRSAGTDERQSALYSTRNFYGSLRVSERIDARSGHRIRVLYNGNINHGEQFAASDSRAEPLTYYTRGSGIGIALEALGRQAPLRVGVVGLGAGTLAAYGRPGDAYRFYELDPAILTAARDHFWYLQDCRASWTVVLGDARLSLEREAPQRFDVLAIDAFTSDAIPTHLLTREAFAVYWRHLAPDGVLALHVSNRYVDLTTVVARQAAARGVPATLVVGVDDPTGRGISSEWVIITTRSDFGATHVESAQRLAPDLDAPLWTDDYSSVWQQLR